MRERKRLCIAFSLSRQATAASLVAVSEAERRRWTASMKFVALVSGGKDSCYNSMEVRKLAPSAEPAAMRIEVLGAGNFVVHAALPP